MANQSQKNAERVNPNASAVKQLINQYHEVVFRYAYRLAGQASTAEDITQQTFLIALEKLHQLRNHDAAKSWLLTIARNYFLKLNRKQKVEGTWSELDYHLVDENAESSESAFDFDPAAIKQAIGELDHHHRVVIMMFYFEELSYRQISDQLNVKIGTVMSRLSRAKTKLKQAITNNSPDSSTGVHTS